MSGVSLREQVLRAVVAVLASAGTPSANVFRSRVDQIDQSELPCFDVSPGEEKVEDPGEYGDHDSVTRTLPIAVRALVDSGVAQQGFLPDDSALDPFYVFAARQLTGNGATLAGLVLDVEELSGTVVFQPAGRAILGLEMVFQVRFATKRGDPTQKG